jgi:hypothetical protein
LHNKLRQKRRGRTSTDALFRRREATVVYTEFSRQCALLSLRALPRHRQFWQNRCLTLDRVPSIFVRLAEKV